MSIEAVVFDRDGVLVEIDQARFAAEVLQRVPLDRAELEQHWRCFLGRRVVTDAANETRVMAAFLASLAAELGLDAGALADLDYASAVRAFPEAREALVAARRAGVRVGVLTNNTAAVSASRMLEVAGLGDLVDVAFTSQMIGAGKPDPTSYSVVAAALGSPASACLFFDNARLAVEGARAVGMHAWEVDRTRADHDIAGGIVRDLTAVASILRAAPGVTTR